MVTSLQKINRFVSDAIYQAMLLRDTARATAGEGKFQRLRLARPLKGIAHDGFN
jgi:hypothetical protein